jgi:hypothetical protein
MIRITQLLLALAVANSSLLAQLLPEGYGASVSALPQNASNVLTLPTNEVLWFDGNDLWLDAPGQAPRSLLHFALPVFGSFTIEAGAGMLLFGESSTNGLWLVPIHSVPTTQPIATVVFNYDALLLAPGIALVSAKTGGFATPDNELVAVELTTGATQLLARLPGASGPLALAPNGDLYYATSSLLFPTPPGTTTVLRFRRALVDQALAQHTVLGLPQAELVFAGIDAAADLAFDDDGDLFFTDWWNNTVGELNDATGPAPWHTTLLDYSAAAVSASSLQFLAANGNAVFEPFQPSAGRLCVHETAWASISQVRTVHTEPATANCTLANPVPTGNFAVQVTHGPANGFGLLAIGFAPGLGDTLLTVPGFEAPLHWDAAMSAAFATWFVSFDGAGNASLPLQNPGMSPVQSFLLQIAFVDATVTGVGATAPIVVQLGL